MRGPDWQGPLHRKWEGHLQTGDGSQESCSPPGHGVGRVGRGWPVYREHPESLPLAPLPLHNTPCLNPAPYPPSVELEN